MRKGLLLFILSVAIAVSAQVPPCPTESAISIARGSYESRPGVRYQLVNFQARLVPKGDAPPLCYEKTTLVSKGEIFVSSDSVTRLFAQRLEASHSKIKNLAVSHDIHGATLTGSIDKLVPLHFSIKGPVSTDGSSIRLDAKTVKVDGLPIKELLKLVGTDLNSLVPVRGLPGLTVGDNYFAFSPEAVANLKGHISSVSTSSQGLTLRYAPIRRQLRQTAH